MTRTMFLHRRCRACSKWTTVAKTSEACQWCGSSFGKLDLGIDVLSTSSAPPPDGEPVKGQAKAFDIPGPEPGQFGYVNPGRSRP